MLNKNYQPVNSDVLTLAIEQYFPDKEISLVDLHETVNWKVYETEKEEMFEDEKPKVLEETFINFDIRLAEKVLKNFFQFQAVHIEYSGFIRGKIYFES